MDTIVNQILNEPYTFNKKTYRISAVPEKDTLHITLTKPNSLMRYEVKISFSTLDQMNDLKSIIVTSVLDFIDLLAQKLKEQKVFIAERDKQADLYFKEEYGRATKKIEKTITVEIPLIEVKADPECLLKLIEDLNSRYTFLEEKYNEMEPFIDDLREIKKKRELELKLALKYISKEEFDLLKLWLPTNISLQLTSLYKATVDGFGAEVFHNKVNNQPSTLHIITASNGNRFGAFTPLVFSSSSNYKSDELILSFLFSFDKKTKFGVKAPNKANAIYDNPGYGPTFGSGHDLHIATNSNTNSNSYSNLSHGYDCAFTNGTNEAKNFLAGAYNFQTKEIEVYRLG